MLSEGLRVSRSYVHSVAPPVMPVVSSGRIQLDDEHNHLGMVQEIWPKWPDQNGQSRLSAPVSEFVEAGEPIERRSPKENVTVTTSW